MSTFIMITGSMLMSKVTSRTQAHDISSKLNIEICMPLNQKHFKNAALFQIDKLGHLFKIYT